MNRIHVIGRNTKDVEIMTSNNDEKSIAIAHGSIATNEFYEEEATFINYTAFDKKAEFIDRYAWKKGQKLFIDGHLKMSTYKDKDGKKRTSYDIIVDNIEPIDRISEDEEEEEEEKTPPKKTSRRR